jgi:DNA-binding MarR family transcriptional regulator
MSEQKQITTIQDAKSWGRILHNTNLVKLLSELSKGPLSKGKIADVLKVTYGTVNGYVAQLINLGIVREERAFKDGKTIVHIVRLKCSGVFMVFKDLKQEKGWRNDAL